MVCVYGVVQKVVHKKMYMDSGGDRRSRFQTLRGTLGVKVQTQRSRPTKEIPRWVWNQRQNGKIPLPLPFVSPFTQLNQQ